VCYDFNIPDDVIRIIMEYVKTNTLKYKFNISFMWGQYKMIEDNIKHWGGEFTSHYPGPFELMGDDMDGFMTTYDPLTGLMIDDRPLLVDWDYLMDSLNNPKSRNDGKLLVSTITDFIETGGANCGEGLSEYYEDSDSDSDDDDSVIDTDSESDWSDSD
jgi:hypothetical protein